MGLGSRAFWGKFGRIAGTVALNAAEIVPMGGTAKMVVRAVKEVRSVEPMALAGAEKKAIVLKRLGGASDEIGQSVSAIIDWIVAGVKLFEKLKAARAAAKATPVEPTV